MMHAIQNMELRSNHACFGSLHENKYGPSALDVVLVKGTHCVVLSLVIYLQQLHANLRNTYRESWIFAGWIFADFANSRIFLGIKSWIFPV